MKRYFLILTIMVCAVVSNAQTDADALLFSTTEPGGTARGLSLGGAGGALGGDLTFVGINPAGLGIYRKSEFMFTPGIMSNRTNSTYLGTKTSSSRNNFHVNNIGLVITMMNGSGKKEDGWNSLNLGFGMQRVANFHSRKYFEGFNSKSSMVDAFYDKIATGNADPSQFADYYPFDVNLAWETFLLDTLMDANGNIQYFQAVPSGRVQQSKSIQTRGAIDDYYFAMGANYGNKLYIGGTVSIPVLKFSQEATYNESDVEDTIFAFNSFTYYDSYRTSGAGVNLKLGLIYRVNNFIRLGGSVQSPTFYSLTDRYNASMSSDFNSENFNWESPNGRYNYTFTTPWKATGSMAFLLKEYGFISVDYEFTDYSDAYFDDSDLSATTAGTNAVNQAIQFKYGPSSNIRVGGEAKLDIFFLRAGYSYRTSPFQPNIAEPGGEGDIQNISFGFGVREKGYFLDFGYIRSVTSSAYFPYTLSNSNNYFAAINESITNRFIMTLGFSF